MAGRKKRNEDAGDGYADGGELSENEFHAGVEVSNAIQRGVRNFSTGAQQVLQRFVLAVTTPYRTGQEPLPPSLVQRAVRSLKRRSH